AVLRAQGLQESAILEAEGRKQAQIAIAEADAQTLEREGQGRAAAVAAEGKAEAEKIRAVGLAEAEKLQATGLAQAKSIEAQGLAEAAAIKEKAAAWREFNDAARLQTILEKLPAIIESSAPVFRAVAEPLGKIDKIVMIDQGGNGHNGDSGIHRFAQTTPTLIFSLLQQLQALGLNLPEIMAQLGVDKNGSSAEKTVTPPNGPTPKPPPIENE
ncbi:MAG: flotillin domain-containing protein, partial [Acidobacteriota bacterium]